MGTFVNAILFGMGLLVGLVLIWLLLRAAGIPLPF